MSDPYYVIDLESGSVWANNKTGITLTYAFWTSTPTYDPYFSDYSGFQTFTATMQTAVQADFALISSFANVTFQQVSPSPQSAVDIGFGMANIDPDAEAYTYVLGSSPAAGTMAGDVWANKQYFTNSGTDPNATHVTAGDFDYITLLHEIGHSLGLKHSFEGSNTLPGAEDTTQYTVMSYTNSSYYGGSHSDALYPETYMPYDIAAIQALYGANTTYHTGDDTYTLQANHIYTIWDAGGTDTLDGSAQSMSMVLDLREGHYSSVGNIHFLNGFTLANNIAIAYGVTIENANGGAGNDTIYDNAANNLIHANGGDDIVYLTTGNDSLDGGSGYDTVYINGNFDAFSYLFPDATTVIVISASFTDTLTNVENFHFTDSTIFHSPSELQLYAVGVTLSGTAGSDILTGSPGPDILSGNDGTDTLTGMAGRDTLDGGAGIDKLAGGTGNDTYIVDLILSSTTVKLQDTITENLNEGNDTVILRAGDLGLTAASNILLGTNLENLDASQTGTNHLNLTGNALKNILTGNDYGNMLDGGAGLSGDTLIGGKGDDTYLIHSLNDTVIENPGEGNDTIVYVTSSTGSSSLSLASYANVENLTVTGAGTAVLTGNSGDNILTGNASANIFKGGDGNDTYIVGTGDLIVETASTGGNDTVISNASFGLSLYIENLTLTGTSAINGTGNTEDNIITGNSGANILNGGSGADSLIGGAGNDTYVIDNIGDTVTEAPGAGTDIIQSSITFDLVAHGVNVENLTLMASNGNIEGYGNTLANAITGNEGANILDGREGVDKLSGGLGDDTYIVDLIAVNGIAKLQDTVTELTNAGNDTLDLRAGDLGLLTATKLTLAASLENLDISLTGVNKINLTGNTLNNILTGNDWDNTISGGTGADTMNGGNGNDTLIVDNAGDSVSGGAGTDTILSSVNWDLTHSPDVENLTLTGTTALHGTGNGLANIITGTTGANLLDGGDGDDRLLGLAGSDTLLGGLGHDILDGGAGIDTLTGGGDSDTFVFHAAQATSAANADIITDFTAGPGGDALDIHDILVGYAGGPLGNFVHLTETNGNTIVSVDANGLTSGSAFVQIATLQGVTGLNADQMVTDVNLIVT